MASSLIGGPRTDWLCDDTWMRVAGRLGSAGLFCLSMQSPWGASSRVIRLLVWQFRALGDQEGSRWTLERQCQEQAHSCHAPSVKAVTGQPTFREGNTAPPLSGRTVKEFWPSFLVRASLCCGMRALHCGARTFSGCSVQKLQ